MPKFSSPALALTTPSAPASRRYYIMGAASLPDGTAFAVADSHQHLLTEFAMGYLSVKQVVDALTMNSLAAPAIATLL